MLGLKGHSATACAGPRFGCRGTIVGVNHCEPAVAPQVVELLPREIEQSRIAVVQLALRIGRPDEQRQRVREKLLTPRAFDELPARRDGFAAEEQLIRVAGMSISHTKSIRYALHLLFETDKLRDVFDPVDDQLDLAVRA